MSTPTAIVVGSGPNGLAAAITLARAGVKVTVLEASDVPGGGARTLPLTLPGFLHDHCSSVYPLGIGSPFFKTLPLAEHGLEWIQPDLPLAHPLDDGTAAVLHRSLEQTADALGVDARRYRRHLGPLVAHFPEIVSGTLDPFHLPKAPFALARFGLAAAQPAKRLARRWFHTEAGRALVAGNAAHSFLPLEAVSSAAIGLVMLAAAHAVGWPFVRGGAQNLINALLSLLRAHRGELRTGVRVTELTQVAEADVVLFDVNPGQLLQLAGGALSSRDRRALSRFKHGPGTFKVDYALDGPLPWKAEACHRAGTLHLGGTLDDIAAAERATARGQLAERPFVLAAQPTVCDPTRAPPGKHVFWAYAHVPHASTADALDRLESQIERFAPGFQKQVLARSILTPARLEQDNPNMVGGDISGGAMNLKQVLARPWLRVHPHRTSNPRLFLCSSSTAPGGGVHGMCGHLAAKAALKELSRGAKRRAKP